VFWAYAIPFLPGCSGLQPGLIARCADAAETAAFDQLYTAITKEHSYWCCAAEVQPFTSFKYSLPQPLSSEYRHLSSSTEWCGGGHLLLITKQIMFPLLAILADGASVWEPPELALPTWCDEVRANERQREFVLYANHPCQFLTNSSAALEAAAIA
jgi:hypothetical protein